MKCFVKLAYRCWFNTSCVSRTVDRAQVQNAIKQGSHFCRYAGSSFDTDASASRAIEVGFCAGQRAFSQHCGETSVPCDVGRKLDPCTSC